MLKNILWGMLNICDLHLIKSQSVYVDLSMPEDKKRAQQKYKTMEGNYLTAGDLALIENRRGYGYGDGYGHYGCYGHGKGMAATGIGLAAGLGGGALSGGHYDEEFARHDISKMLPRGEYWSLKQVEDATKGMSFPQGTTPCDKWVAFNAFANDLDGVLSDENIIKVAYAFWFADKDWVGKWGKIWTYMCSNQAK